MLGDSLLSGKRLLVTGGGTGLGKAVARRAVELGAEVSLCGRRADVLEKAAEEFDALGRMRTRIFTCDLRDAGQVTDLMDRIWAEGPLDILLNNAAGTVLARTETLSPRAFDAVLSTSLHGAIYTTLEAGRRWIAERRAGTLAYTLAAGLDDGRPFMVPVTVAKGALQTLIRSLAVEWGRHGIRTVGVAPGNFPTPGAASRLHADRDGDPENAIPLGRIGRHEEFADLFAYLLSDLASYITGEVIAIDGGKGLRTNGVDDLFAWTPERWARLRAA